MVPNPSHSDVIRFSYKLPEAAHCHTLCIGDHSPPSSASGVTCPTTSTWFVQEPHRIGEREKGEKSRKGKRTKRGCDFG
ncbi:hypothetical protein MTR_4g071510 [Medicago truncatula]|uniref:Uncharacterized protein n=1 Tax=Medicago truncatula TaxID=3880 RepID=G7JJT3_MEDTR|nr:hypothetical protein MTR_4g071510 [Medicago truncatula]